MFQGILVDTPTMIEAVEVLIGNEKDTEDEVASLLPLPAPMKAIAFDAKESPTAAPAAARSFGRNFDNDLDEDVPF